MSPCLVGCDVLYEDVRGSVDKTSGVTVTWRQREADRLHKGFSSRALTLSGAITSVGTSV